MKQRSTFKMVMIANLSAISIILYLIGSFVPIFSFYFAPFLNIQFSNLPAIIGGFVMGPVAGSMVVVVRALVKLPFTSTGGVGELADLIIGVSTVVIASLIYRKYHTKKGAIYASIAGVITWTTVAVLANWLFLLRFYVNLYGFDAVIGMLRGVDYINEDNFYWMFSLVIGIPFNLGLSVVVYFFTFIVYKRISGFFKQLNEQFND